MAEAYIDDRFLITEEALCPKCQDRVYEMASGNEFLIESFDVTIRDQATS